MKAFLALAALLLPTLASPCTWTFELSPLEELEQGYDQSDAVFVAKVLSVTPDTSTLRGAFRMTLQVERVWKSDGPPPTEVISGRGDGDCTIGPMTVGARYIVFASRSAVSNHVFYLGEAKPVLTAPIPTSEESTLAQEFDDKRYKLALAVLEERSR